MEAFANKMPTSNLHILEDVKQEKMLRQRAVQVNTAKRVIKRFCPDKIQKHDRSMQTDTEQIAVFKDYYENQIDAMMDREIDVRSTLKQAVHKNDMQKNRIDLLEKRLTESKTQIDIKRQQIDNLELKLQVAVDDMKAKESRYNTLELKLATYQGIVEEKDKLALRRLQELDAKKDELRKR